MDAFESDCFLYSVHIFQIINSLVLALQVNSLISMNTEIKFLKGHETGLFDTQLTNVLKEIGRILSS